MMYKISFFVLLATLFINCQQPASKSTEKAQQVISNAQDTANYSMVDFKRISPYFQSNNDQIDTTFYAVQYPSFENDRLNEMINNILLYEGEKNLEEASDNFLTSYNLYVEDNDNGISKSTWFKDIKVKVHINSPKILTMSNFTYEFTGGAHGNYYTLYTNYDHVNNEIIKLENIIPDYKKSELLEIAEKEFRKLENISDSSAFNNKYFFDNHQFQLAENFALIKDSLLFYYNVYEIKAYSEGPTELKIPYNAIKGLFNERGLQYIKSIIN